MTIANSFAFAFVFGIVWRRGCTWVRGLGEMRRFCHISNVSFFPFGDYENWWERHDNEWRLVFDFFRYTIERATMCTTGSMSSVFWHSFVDCECFDRTQSRAVGWLVRAGSGNGSNHKHYDGKGERQYRIRGMKIKLYILVEYSIIQPSVAFFLYIPKFLHPSHPHVIINFNFLLFPYISILMLYPNALLPSSYDYIYF